MKFVFSFSVLVLFLLISSSVEADYPPHFWSYYYGDTHEQVSQSVAVDGGGNIIITGFFQSTVDFGGGPLVSVGSSDVFLVKFDSNGGLIWDMRMGNSENNQSTMVLVDSQGNILLPGLREDGFQSNVYLTKFNPDGAHIWSRSFPGQYFPPCRNAAVDQNDNIFIADYFLGNPDFGGGPLANAGGHDIYVAKFDSSGQHLWSQPFGDSESQYVQHITADDDGNVIIVGSFQGTVNFGGGVLMSAGQTDIYIAKLDTDGNHIWSQRFGDSNKQNAIYAHTDNSGSIFVTGWSLGTVDFGSGPLPYGGMYDTYLAKFDSGGNHLWSYGFGDSINQTGYCIAVESNGIVIFGGSFGGTVDFGGGPLVGTADRMFLAKYDPDGSHIWSQCYGDSGEWQWPNSMTTDSFDNLIVTGMFQGVLDFGENHLSSIESSDAFLVKFGNTVVPAQLQSYSTAHTPTGIEIRWYLADGDPDLDFFILRADATNKQFTKLDRPNIFRQDLAFTFIDYSIVPGRTYIYRVGTSGESGQSILFETDPLAVPRLSLSLSQSFPNPFNPQTTFRYSIPKTGMVSLKVYNAQGRYIRTLIESPKTAGEHEQTWDGRNDNGTMMGSGIYFIRLESGGKAQSRKVILIK
jgi:hypothetical protein